MTPLEPHRALLWGLCYRMTGSAADAEDLVQETFVRALERPPEVQENLRPWLMRVAANLARDALRRRKRRHYDGPWLPEPIDTDALPDESALPADTRYGRLESVTLAFLVALEALSPPQRAVLLLRDVYGLDVDETARALALSEANVRVLHHRARGRLATFDETRGAPDAMLATTLMTLVDALARGDVAATTRLLAPGVELRTDGGGIVHAALRIVTGADRVARGLVGLTQRGGGNVTGVALRSVNGRPALVVEQRPVRTRDATRQMLTLQTDALGRVVAIYSVLAPTKLARLS